MEGIREDLQRLYETEYTDEEREKMEQSGEAYDLYSYIADNALDLEYTVSAYGGEFLGARIYVTLGGPTVYVDTRDHCICGRWGTDWGEIWLPFEIADEINSIVIDYYEISSDRR